MAITVRPLGTHVMLALLVALLLALLVARPLSAAPAEPVFNDVHFHLTNYVQQGTRLRDYARMMETTVGRSTVFGIPLQQTWSYANTGDWAPTYYLQTDAPLYYYSFTDAHIASEYLRLDPSDRARFDPMITGFNPADMYAVDHIRRVLETFPGVFSGIGEFTIHKEFVSSKVAGEIASLTNPALDRILAFAEETGLVVLLHNDADMPFPKSGQEPYMLAQLKALFARHPEATIIWAHIGLGRVVRPLAEHAAMVEKICTDPDLAHVYLDISWDEVAKYATADPDSTARVADMINRYPERFLFGSDVVAPQSIDSVTAVYDAYAPLWEALTAEARALVLRDNYQRLFDAARTRVRAWEKDNLP